MEAPGFKRSVHPNYNKYISSLSPVGMYLWRLSWFYVLSENPQTKTFQTVSIHLGDCKILIQLPLTISGVMCQKASCQSKA